ncbi:PTS system, galactitol-specific IIA component [Sporolactobacillus inulinus]|uniref:PTS system, galactitol-specific IIA component n=1 Tax=Sporolactobacillus inulinus TaxID=2078 RepID=A0A4Y1ZC87_9BACL|nr:PTS sugar transporter subunit IIA [Sporolactobacillus inulinus]GAY76665.1 PTS system, galactitol-specific IIA component [Sporolactobacillus inulinus]
MNYSNLFQKDLIVLNADYQDQNDLFKSSFKSLQDKGLVNASYYAALMERESLYPTGLANDKIQFAIPHTDVIHVNRPFVHVIRLKKPIRFAHMGMSDQPVDAEIVFMLGIKDPKGQVGLLSEIMSCFNDQSFIDHVRTINDSQQMEVYLKAKFGR